MVLRERRSGLEGWLGERRCGFEARLHEGCDGCVLSRSAISRDSAIVQFEDSKKCNNWRGVVDFLRKLRRLEISLLFTGKERRGKSRSDGGSIREKEILRDFFILLRDKAGANV